MSEREIEELDPEVPAEDALEQRGTVGDEEPDEDLPQEMPADVDPADLAEQRRTVALDDEEYS
ncbi:MAG: hypothetical protein ACRDWY_02775 [Actinomycetes bacterium]